MPEQEGVIKYRLDFSSGDAPDYARFAQLNYWRCYLYRWGLVGQDAARYGGLGFGNISARLQPDLSEFIISGTQTGHLPVLCRDHYVRVSRFDLNRNFLQAHGPIKPSSEALTHASIYQSRNDVHCIMHLHCPRIWHYGLTLGIPVVAATVGYGTPEMAQAVSLLVQQGADSGVIVMAGHEDGVLVYGPDEDGTGAVLSELLQTVNE